MTHYKLLHILFLRSKCVKSLGGIGITYAFAIVKAAKGNTVINLRYESIVPVDDSGVCLR